MGLHVQNTPQIIQNLHHLQGADGLVSVKCLDQVEQEYSLWNSSASAVCVS